MSTPAKREADVRAVEGAAMSPPGSMAIVERAAGFVAGGLTGPQADLFAMGEGLWRFERAGDTTRLSYRWRTEPTGLLRLSAPVLPSAASQSTIAPLGA